MGRLREETLERTEKFADRVLDVADELEQQRLSRRIIDQITGSGTAVGANAFEAAEAMSTKDFLKSLAIILKELNETRFWLRRCASRGWVKAERLESLMNETTELRMIFSAMAVRTKRKLRVSAS